MSRLARHGWCVATALVVPWLVLAAPAPLKLAGILPAWSVLWLLPWAISDGPVSGALAGLGLGLLLDALTLDGATQIPALVLLGWWWGRLGRKGPPLERSFSLGLLALIGTFLLGLTLILQRLGLPPQLPLAGSLRTLLTQTLLTGLLAPMICSLLLLLWRQQNAPSRG